MHVRWIRAYIRLIAKLRGDFPVVFFAVPFLGGQMAALVAGWEICAANCILLLVGSFYGKGRCAGVTPGLIFFTGAFSALFISLPPQHRNLDAGHSVTGHVSERPRHHRPGEITFTVIPEEVSAGKLLCRAIDLPWRNSSALKSGDRIAFTGTFRRIEPDPDPFSYNNYLLRYGYSATCKVRYLAILESAELSFFDMIRGSLAETVRNFAGNNEKSGLFLSMSIGQRDVLSQRTEEAFKRTGLAHLLVVSGYQVTLVYILCVTILGAILIRIPRLYAFLNIDLCSNIFAGIVALVFIMVCGIEGSGVRAILASCITFLARSTERGGGFLNGITISLVILAVIWPGCWLEPGMQLTFMALLGICMGSYRQYEGLKNFVMICFNVSLLTSLTVLFWFEGFSLFTFVLNPIFAPIISILSCNIGFAALGLYSAGIDPNGLLLGSLIETLSAFAGLLRLLSASELCYFAAGGIIKWPLALAIGSLTAVLAARNFRLYRLKNNI